MFAFGNTFEAAFGELLAFTSVKIASNRPSSQAAKSIPPTFDRSSASRGGAVGGGEEAASACASTPPSTSVATKSCAAWPLTLTSLDACTVQTLPLVSGREPAPERSGGSAGGGVEDSGPFTSSASSSLAARPPTAALECCATEKTRLSRTASAEALASSARACEAAAGRAAARDAKRRPVRREWRSVDWAFTASSSRGCGTATLTPFSKRSSMLWPHSSRCSI
mmetsp:Transcript_24664/g.61717  ORF Transcript_24664/g.61717 Transcript_24664/m.61717 type:complete len:224 (-) Transcript_24664:1154-1825(-)